LLAQQLGCALEDGPMGPFIKVGVFRETTVANVFACGDAARAAATWRSRSATGRWPRGSASLDVELTRVVNDLVHAGPAPFARPFA
jgi:thioredoxin reductase